MVWHVTDDNFYLDPSVVEMDLSEIDRGFAIGLFTSAGAWCSKHLKTGGTIKKRTLFRLFGVRKAYMKRIVSALIQSGLWTEVDEETIRFTVWKYDEKKIEKKRESGRNRMRKCRERKRLVESVTASLESNERVSSDVGDSRHNGVGDAVTLDPYLNHTNSIEVISNEITKPRARAQAVLADVERVFFFWAEMFDKDRARVRLTTNRAKAVQARLSEGYSVEDLQNAIRGAASNGWMVENGHTDLATIVKDDASVERHKSYFANRAAMSEPAPPSNPEDFVEHDLDDLLQGKVRPQDDVDKCARRA